MSGITLTEAQNHLQFWLTADRKLSRGEVSRVADQRLDRAPGETVAERIDYWQRMVNRLSRSSGDIGPVAAFSGSKI